jgi:hypothetical protein
MRKQLALASLAVLAAATATPARADVVIGPRVSYYFDNSNLRTSGIDPGLDEGDALDPADIAVLRTAFGVEPQLTTVSEGEGVLSDQVGYRVHRPRQFRCRHGQQHRPHRYRTDLATPAE